MSKQRKCVGKESFERMNYLYQVHVLYKRPNLCPILCVLLIAVSQYPR